MPLNDRQLRALSARERPYKLADGGGLLIRVTPNGSKLWRLAYRFAGKQKELALGAYPAVGLADAREKRREAKESLARGLDPAEVARGCGGPTEAEPAATFAKIAEELIAKQERERKATATLGKKRWFLSLLDASFKDRPINEITASDVLAPLRRIEAKGNFETAKRLRAFTGQVFRYAIATARADNDPTYGLRGALIAPQVDHRAAITDEPGFAKLIAAIWNGPGANPATRTALKLMAMLYSRPGELRLARWSEFDLERAVWTIPASRAKMRREHRKPLPGPALSILNEIRAGRGNDDLVIESDLAPGRPISENTMNAALRRMGFDKETMSAHGFRASASSLLNECGRWNPDAIEAELAHVGSDQVRRAYHRAAYWQERVQIAEWWASGIMAKAARNGEV